MNVDVLAIATRTTLVITALGTLVDWLRHRDRPRFDIHIMFAALAGIIILSQLSSHSSSLNSQIARTGTVALFILHPYLLLRLVLHFRPVPRVIQRGALAGLIFSLAALPIIKYLPKDIPLVLVVIFLLVEGYATAAFFERARTTRGANRWKCGLAAGGSLSLALIFLVAGLNVFMKLPRESLQPFNQGAALFTSVCYLFAFITPRWVRRGWQSAELYRFLGQANDRSTTDEAVKALDQLCDGATCAVGSISSVAASWDNDARAFRVRASDMPGLVGLNFALEHEQLLHGWKSKSPVFVAGPLRHISGLELLMDEVGAEAVLAVPIATTDWTWGLLLVLMRTGALFAEDNLALLSLMAERSARSVKIWELQARYRTMLDSAPFALVAVNQAGAIVEVNVETTACFGYPAGEMTGLSVASLFPAGLGDSLENFSLKHAVCLQAKKRDGSLFPASLRVSRVTVEGQSVFMLTVEDITERERAEQAIAERTAQLQQANHELEAFSYSVSHDLRAPLRAIDGFSRILEEDFANELSPDAGRYLKRVRDNTHQMSALIDDLLAFSRLGRQPLHKSSVNTLDLVLRAYDETSRFQNGQPVELAIGELPDCQADPALLKQVLVNLISNAIKFSRHSESPKVSIGFLNDGASEAFFVKDNGVGFDMAYANKLFGVFQRLHRQEDYEGTGVGLAIVQRIIHQHGGGIWADAKPGEGATFYFTLEGGVRE